MDNLTDIREHFRFEGEFLDVETCGKGHINDTLALSYRRSDGRIHRYVLQKINQYVFKRPVEVVENIERVTAHLRQKIEAVGGDPDRETLNLIPTITGNTYYQDVQGEYWRGYYFIENASTFETATNPEQLYNTGWAFGHFQEMLADFPAELLHETIVDFHNTPRRFNDFLRACKQDLAGRTSQIKTEIEFLMARKADTEMLIERNARGSIPLRVTHNDTKLNNLMIDNRSGKAICVLDLDTVMPGLALYDFGDAVRTAAACISEDDPDWAKAGILLDNFENLAHGYLDAARSFLVEDEIMYLAFSARLITLEQAIRFLTDHINGDVYYKIHRPNQNLDRARTQIKMVQDMENKYHQMQAVISKYS